MFITNNNDSFHLRWKENLVKHQKVSKYYDQDCSRVHPWNLSTRRTLICVVYVTRRQVYWSLTHNVLFAGTLIWYHTHTQTHTPQTHTARTGASRMTYPYKYIFTPPVMCSQQLSLLHKWIIHWYQKFSFHNVFSFQRLLTCKSHLSVD